MATYADKVLVHGPEAIEALHVRIHRDLGDRLIELRHPMFDSLLNLAPTQPPELANQSRCFRFLCFGLLRPYKGAYELVRAMRQLLEHGKLETSQLIVAGQLIDSAVARLVERLPEAFRKHIVVVNRRLSNSELVWLLKNSNVAVLPYRAVLTSGAYHLASTFKLPSIAPDLGQFRATGTHGKDVLKYTPRIGLKHALALAMEMDSEELSSIGYGAYEKVAEQTEASFSLQFQRILEDLWQH